MRLRRFALALLVISAGTLITALPVRAKEGVKATLTTSIPLDAPAGTQLKVSWRLFSIETGQREPFGANGVFVRLRSASGADAEEGFAPVGAYPTGEYEATVVVPEGGIADIEVGLMGWRSDATGTRRADALFPITNSPVPGVVRVAPPASGQPVPEGPDSGSTTWVVLLVAGVLSTLAVLASAIVLRRKRSRDATPIESEAHGRTG
jgi:hypothetical protein